MKKAYPNYPEQDSPKPIYNLNKWVEAMRDIYTKVHFGMPKETVIQATVKDWGKFEAKDFQQWLSFYEEGGNHKYNLKPKTAAGNMYMPENIGGYYLPNVPSPVVHPKYEDMSQPLETVVKPAIEEKEKKLSDRHLIEEQRKKIIGRLNAAVKNLTMNEGHLLAGDEFDELLSSMYDLIKKFQMVNKVSRSSQLYVDLIIRQANILSRKGHARSSRFLYKFAQNAAGGPNNTSSPLPIASEQSGGSLDNPLSLPGLSEAAVPPAASADGSVPPAPDAAAPPAPPAGAATPPATLPIPPAPPKEEKKRLPTDPLDKLLDNLDTSGLTDSNFIDDLEVLLSDEDQDEDEDNLVVKAQAAPEGVPVPSARVDAPAADGGMPVANPAADLKKEPSDGNLDQQKSEDIDALLDRAFANITIDDLIAKLEEIQNFFTNRLISKQLSVIDIMMSRLGLSGYFNNFNELAQKNNEAVGYCTTRVQDIISKLKSVSTGGDNELPTEATVPVTPEIAAVQNALEQQQQKEKERKQVRKNQENVELDKKVSPVPSENPNLQDLAKTPAPQVI